MSKQVSQQALVREKMRGQPAELPGVSAEPGLEPAAHHAHRGEREQTWAERAEHTHMDEQWGPQLWQDTEMSRVEPVNGQERLGGVMSRWERNTTALTFLRSVAYDDLSASFAGLLHRERSAEALLVLSQALAFFEAVLLHDLVGHRTSAWSKEWKKGENLGSGLADTLYCFIHNSNENFWIKIMNFNASSTQFLAKFPSNQD